MFTPREKLQGCIWEFTIGDADDHPSIPHAHSRGEGYRLDAWTGDIYPAGKERKDTIGKLNKKELQKLHSDPKLLAFARKQIDWYRAQYPHISFYVPDWFEQKLMQRRKLGISGNEETDKYIFYGYAVILKGAL